MDQCRRDIIALFSALPLIMLTSCSRKDQASSLNQHNEMLASSGRRSTELYLVLKTLDNPFFTEIQRGVEDSAHGRASLTVRAGRNESDISGQREILEQLLVQIGSNRGQAARSGLLLTPSGSSDQLVSPVRRFREQGIPVVILDTRIEQAALARGNTDIDLFIGSDNRQGGVLAAEALLGATDQVRNRRIKILLLNGEEASETAQARRAGFLERIRRTNAEVTERTARWRRSEARDIVATLLASGGNYDAVFAANDEMALGVVGAYSGQSAIPRPPIIGFDAINEARTAVRAGELFATVAQDPYGMGRRGADSLIGGIDSAHRDMMIPVQLVRQ